MEEMEIFHPSGGFLHVFWGLVIWLVSPQYLSKTPAAKKMCSTCNQAQGSLQEAGGLFHKVDVISC